MPPLPMQQLQWDLSFLADNSVVRTKRFGIPAEAKAVRYPIRLLRYWFGYHLLRVEAQRSPRPLEVAEVGVHTGQMLEFLGSAPVVPTFARWTAVDAVMLTEKLRQAGYTDFFEANLEDPSFDLPADYDVAVMLHILEHLFEPEEAPPHPPRGRDHWGISRGAGSPGQNPPEPGAEKRRPHGSRQRVFAGEGPAHGG